MAVPKNKVSGARRDKRRSNNSKVAAPAPVACPNCGEYVLPHHVCANCGKYNGKEVIKEKDDKEKKDKKK